VKSLPAAFALALAPAVHAAADVKAGEAKAQVCVQCHGLGGISTNPQYPSLAAQPPLYVQYQLIQFREERRKDPRMSPYAAKLTDADMKDLAAYFTAQPPAAPAGAADAAKVAAGRTVVDRLHCGSCHMPDFAGQKHIARLAGQHYDYLVKQLRGFKTGARPDIDGLMVESAQPLTDQDILDVAYYLSTFKP
jgi:cytochrome c553